MKRNPSGTLFEGSMQTLFLMIAAVCLRKVIDLQKSHEFFFLFQMLDMTVKSMPMTNWCPILIANTNQDHRPCLEQILDLLELLR